MFAGDETANPSNFVSINVPGMNESPQSGLGGMHTVRFKLHMLVFVYQRHKVQGKPPERPPTIYTTCKASRMMNLERLFLRVSSASK